LLDKWRFEFPSQFGQRAAFRAIRNLLQQLVDDASRRPGARHAPRKSG
jgi:hypothetical protein